MNSKHETQGAWIFVSHSHRDLEKVREIRNYLEQRGHNPLLFFLKCLNDDDARLPELIRDEIKERDWFVLCDSPNAKASKYVPAEVALVQSAKSPETIETIDLTQDLKPQLYKLDRLLKRATVFLSHSYVQRDHECAERIRAALLEHDYRVWSDSALKPGQDFAATIHAAIDDAAALGFVLLLLSPASLASPSCKQETEYALQLAAKSQRSNVIPVVVAPFMRGALPLQLTNIQWFDLTTGPFEERVEDLIRNLKTREME